MKNLNITSFFAKAMAVFSWAIGIALHSTVLSTQYYRINSMNIIPVFTGMDIHVK